MEKQAITPPLLLLFFCFAIKSFASDPLFYESFDRHFEGRWIVSEKDDYQQGEWKHSKSEGHEDYGLLVSGEPRSEWHEDYGFLVGPSGETRKYAIVNVLDNPIQLKAQTIALQFETRHQNGLRCGEANLKYIRPQEVGWKATDFDNESTYTILFGPIKCGIFTDRVDFILKHKNPKSGEYIGHHLKNPPSVPDDRLTHVYTAILKPDNMLHILIDGEEKKKANFLSADDFDPPLIPPKTIPDPDDKKPGSWDERAKIADPDAVKPNDWDEDAPMKIVDEEAVKPEGWLDDEPEETDDSEANKPEGWNDEEDGEWVAPKIPNPRCEVAPGCGEWKRPKKTNPAYKGKWHAPLIDNPNYKGVWQPQQIPNPDYFELDKPNFEPIAAVGIEIWTKQDGILFDNILIADSEEVTESYRQKTWKPKYDAEREEQNARITYFLRTVNDDMFKKSQDAPSLAVHKSKIIEVMEKVKSQSNLTIGILVSLVLVVLYTIFRIVRKHVPLAKPSTGTPITESKAATTDDASEQEEESEEDTGTKEEEESEEDTRVMISLGITFWENKRVHQLNAKGALRGRHIMR